MFDEDAVFGLSESGANPAFRPGVRISENDGRNLNETEEVQNQKQPEAKAGALTAACRHFRVHWNRSW